MRTRCLVALAAGVALAFSFPSVHAYWLLPLAVAAFFVVTDGLPVRSAWLPGLVFGGAFQVTLLFWLHVVGIVPWLGLALTQTVWYAALAAAVVPLRRLPAAPLWLAVAWVAMESVRCTWPAGGMPWGRLSYAVVGTPVAGALPFVGATGVSLVLALAGALLATAYAGRDRRARLIPLAGVLGVLAVASVPVVAPYSAPQQGQVQVAAVQGNVPGDGTDVLAHYRQITRQHEQETERLGR
ncbi:MAG TPA: apolipoprotein N-acyltransferase, partial [Nocardioides sp.]|nr:apolipoprotein N-acyltransferase [Nocardioides sp.]